MTEKSLPRNVDTFPNLDATQAAAQSLGMSGARTVPGVAFWQGPRLMFISALGFTTVAQALESRSVSQRDLKDVEQDPMALLREAFNRAKDATHVKKISNYLQQEDVFVLPALIVNVPPEGGSVRLLCNGDPRKAPQVLAWLVIDDAFSVVPTDGQHRGDGIKDALQKRPDLRASSVGIMVSFEQDQEQVQQDFADCAQTKQISPSLMQFYNRRAMSARFVQELTKQCDLFAHGKVDPESKSMSRGSVKLFLHSQVVSFVKALVAGRKASTEEFEGQLTLKLGDDEYHEKIIGFINDITAVVQPYPKLAKMGLADRDRIPDLREEGWITMTSSGLAALGLVGRRLLHEDTTATDYAAAIKGLGSIDWRYSGALWANNICIAKDEATGKVTKVQTGTRSVEAAAKAILEVILPLQQAA